MVHPDELAWIDAPTMAEIDRVTIEDAGVLLIQMMENAGRSLASFVRRQFSPGRVVVLAGSGGNGGGGLVAARHLINTGVEVAVVLSSDRERFGEVPAHQLAAVEWLGAEVITGVLPDQTMVEVDVVIDAMVGYSLAGELSGKPASLTEQINTGSVKIVSLDVPSGLSSNASPDGSTVVAADSTLTLCLPKEGLRHRPEAGRLLLADISVPSAVVSSVTGKEAPPFGRGAILEIAAS